jgi:hypothetical protein
MNYRPFEDTLDALLNPKFINHSSTNMDIIEPSVDQKAAMGKRFHTNSRVYMYGNAVTAIDGPNTPCSIDFVNFTVTASSTSNCVSIRKMDPGQFGVFALTLVGSGGGYAGEDVMITEEEALAPYTTQPSHFLGQTGWVRKNVTASILTSYWVDCKLVYAATPGRATPIPAYTAMSIDRNINDLNTNPFADPYVVIKDVIQNLTTTTVPPLCVITLNVIPFTVGYLYGWFFVKDFSPTTLGKQSAWDIDANDPAPIPGQNRLKKKLPMPVKRKLK